MKELRKAHLVLLKQAEHVSQERAVLAGLFGCPFVVQMYQHWQDARSVYLLMEYVPGGELFTHLRRAGKFSPDQARFYAAETVLALQYLHAQDIVYRDLKPENILLDARGHIKLTDFGFAKRMNGAEHTYTVVGTPDYLAPEIIIGSGYGRSVDWWALGVLIYEMLVGEAPFSSSDHLHTYQRIVAGRWHFPHDFHPAARDLVRRLTTPEPQKRLGSSDSEGADEVKRHHWFSDVSWSALADRTQPAPFVPMLDHEGDARHFDEYEDEEEEPPPSPPEEVAIDDYYSLFLDF